MPPSKPRTAPEDSRSEASSTKEKYGSVPGLATNGKARRVASGLVAASSLRDGVSAGAAAMATTAGETVGSTGQDVNVGVQPPVLWVPFSTPLLMMSQMQWSTLDTSILHGYRYAYRLNTPSAFSSQYNQIILSRPDVGRLSPTMARRRDQRRQSKEQLANAVRRHFNGLGVQENEVIVDFLYKVKWQGGSPRRLQMGAG
jgi:hypothetical protein